MPPQRLWIAACLLAAGVVLTRIGLQVDASAPWHALACDVLGVVRSVLATAALVWAARTARGPQQRFSTPWLLLAAGAACWSVADVIWLALAVVGEQPWGSAADLFFMLCYPLFCLGVLSLPRQHPRVGGIWAILLDVAVILTAAGAAIWVLLVAPTLAAGSPAAGTFARVIAIAYPLGDLILLWAALDLLFRGRAKTASGSAALLASGAAILITADLSYSLQLLHHTYVSGNSLGVVWCIGLTLIGLAGARQATGQVKPESGDRDARMITAALAAIALLATWGLLIIAPGDVVARAAAGMIVVFVLLRQIHAVITNRRLQADLQRINNGLEERVRERTEELALAQRRLAEAERLEAVGRVAGAVAHDFNNILTAVSGHAELAQLLTDNPAIHGHLEQVIGASQRAADLGRRLVATSRPPATEQRPTDVAAIAAEVLAQLTPTLSKDVAIHLEAPAKGVEVLADGAQLHQVLMNLCVNARDAMPAGGRLEIHIVPGQGAVEIVVADSGCGMTESVRARLFEPYFTTKAVGRGTGLGLATVRGIVRQHGGSIDVETAPGQGTTFRISLPSV